MGSLQPFLESTQLFCANRRKTKEKEEEGKERKGQKGQKEREKGRNGAWVSTEIIEQKGKAIPKYKRINQRSILETVKK